MPERREGHVERPVRVWHGHGRGVLGATSLLNELERFHKAAHEVSDGGVPPMLWFSLAGSQDADCDKTMTTMGQEPFRPP